MKTITNSNSENNSISRISNNQDFPKSANKAKPSSHPSFINFIDGYIARSSLLALIMLMLLTPDSFAGTEGAEFNDLVAKITGVIEGGFGKVITLVSLAGSAIAGFNQKIATAFGAAIPGLICQFGPAIIESNITALI